MIKNKKFIIPLFSVALFLVLAGAVWAQACPPGFTICQIQGTSQCVPDPGTACEATKFRTTKCDGGCGSCLNGYVYCGLPDNVCQLINEVDNPVCVAEGRETDECGQCTGCQPGKILCTGVCQDPRSDDNNCAAAPIHQNYDQCDASCTTCKSDYTSCDGEPGPQYVDCETADMTGDPCDGPGSPNPGGLGICGDGCCDTCNIDQPYVPMFGQFGASTATPVDTGQTGMDQPVIYIDQLDAVQNKDYMNFSTNGNTEFIVNNKGHLMIGLNLAGAVLGAGDNAIYTQIENGAQGNFLLFEKIGGTNPVFSVSHDGIICWNNECRNSWAEVGGGAGLWSEGIEGDEIYYSSDNVGIGIDNPNELLHLKTEPGNNAALDIQSGAADHWAIYHDEGTEDLRFWNVDNRFWFTKEGNFGTPGITLWTDEGSGRVGIDTEVDNEFYINGNGDIQIKIDSDQITNPGDNSFNINNGADDTVFEVNEDGDANSSGCWGPVYIGSTPGRDGNMGGYDGANALCKTEMGDDSAHVCTGQEILNSINCGAGLNPAPGIGYAWISKGPPGYTAPLNDCQGWKSAHPENAGDPITDLGDLWDFGNNRGVGVTCNLVRPFACCR